MHTRKISQITEEYAAFFLISLGYEVLDSNFSSAGGEIDLITYKDHIWHFIEVKGRKQRGFLCAEETVTEDKLEKLELTALAFLDGHDELWQIDLVAVSYDRELKIMNIDLYENISVM